MNRDELRAIQAPLKKEFEQNPGKALYTLSVEAILEPGISCRVEGPQNTTVAGLHPAAGGDGSQACSGDMLLESLVACAGVTLKSVATAMELKVKGSLRAEGVLDFRGTLGVSKEVSVGFQKITLHFNLTSDAPRKKIDKLVELTERYCVIHQTLKKGTEMKRQVELS